MNRAYSTFEIKSVDEEKRILTGIASTPSPDLMDDIVEPKGARFTLPIPLLWQHDSRFPVGHVKRAKVTGAGIEVEAHLAKVDEPGRLKSRLDEAWQSLKAGLVRGLSIGFKPIEQEPIEGSFGYRYLKWAWLELSLVTVAANQEASITAIKSIDSRLRAASGKTLPGVTGQTKERKMKTLQEQLAELKEARHVKFARMGEISEAVKAQSRDFEDAEADEFDTLEAEVKQLDGDIRQKTVECMLASTAKAVSPEPTRGSSSRGPTVFTRTADKDEAFKGQNFTRMVIARALGQIEGVSPVAIAQKRWGQTNPNLVNVIRAAVSGGDSTTATWAAELVSADSYAGDFIEFLKAKTVFDQLPLREVPANVTIKGRDGAATGYWVGESASIPSTAMTFFDVALAPLKVAALAVITNELIRDSSPSAEMLVRDALGDASAQAIDLKFLSATAGVSGVSPDGILWDASATPPAPLVFIPSNGVTAVFLKQDIRDLYAPFITAQNASGLYLVMNPAMAQSIQMLSNALGLVEFPSISQAGGTLMGTPVVTGDNVLSDLVILLKPSDIYKIGDSGLQVSISREATIEMDDTPTMSTKTPAGATGELVSMFQTESTAIKVVRSINFALRRAGVVQFIDGASYTG